MRELNPKMCPRILFCVAFLTAFGSLSGSNILFFMPFGSLSHVHSMAPLMEALSDKGHNVSLLSMHVPKQGLRNVSMLRLDSVNEVIETAKPNYFSLRTFNISLILWMQHVMSDLSCRALLTDANFRKVVQDGSTRYDVIVMDTLFSECGLALVGLLGSPPFVYYCTTSLYTWKAWTLDVPIPFAIVPLQMLALTDRMSFVDRLTNTLVHVLQLFVYNYMHLSRVQRIVAEHHPDLPTLAQIEDNVSLVLTNSHSASLDLRRPLASFVVEVGGTHCRPPKPLPKDLEDFVSGAGDDGFIFFSLGSHIPATGMALQKRAQFLKAFARLKQRVLWKFEEDVPGRPPNVLIRQWAPQQDLLGHPKIKVFITHGGQLSVQEAIYHGVPMLGMPVMADQLSNIKNVVEKGLGEEINYDELDENDIYDKLLRLIGDPSYKRQSAKYADLMRDRPMDALDKAVYWVEYVVRHGGARHLRLGTSHLNFFQYFLLDVIAALCLSSYILYRIVKWCLYLALSSRKGRRESAQKKRN